MDELKIKVTGMRCNHCKINVENQLHKIPGIRVVTANILAGEVTLSGDNIDLGAVQSAVENLGYSFGGKVA